MEGSSIAFTEAFTAVRRRAADTLTLSRGSAAWAGRWAETGALGLIQRISGAGHGIDRMYAEYKAGVLRRNIEEEI